MALGGVARPVPGSGPAGGSISLGAAAAPVVAPPQQGGVAFDPGFDLFGAASGGSGIGQAAMPPMRSSRVEAAPEPAPAPVAPVATEPAVAPAPMSTLEQAIMGDLGMADLYERQANAAIGSMANQLRPLVEAEAQFQGQLGTPEVAPFEAQPFVMPPRKAGESDADYLARVQDAKKQHDATQAQAQAQYEAQAAEALAPYDLSQSDVRDIGKPGHLGMAEAQTQSLEDVGAADIARRQQTAEAMREAAELQRDATAQARAADEERRQHARDQLEALEVAKEVEADARKKIEALPDLDPNRFFRSMSGGNKFWAVLGLIGGGVAGIDVAGQLKNFAMQDLQAQKANAAQAFDQLGAAEAATGKSVALYQDLLQSAGDEAVADGMWLKLQLEDAAQMLEAQIAETTIPVHQAELQAQLVNLRGEIQAQDQMIQTRLATTPRTVMTGGAAARRLRKKADEARARAQSRVDVAIEREGDIGLENVKQAGRLELEGAKAQGAAASKQREKVFDAAAKYGERVEALDTTRQLVDQVLAMDDIAGYGFTAGAGVTAAAKDVEGKLALIEESFGRLQSQGAIGVEEAERFTDMIRGGTTLGGETALRRNLANLKNYLDTRNQVLERGLDPDVREYYNRAKGADFEQRWTGGGSAPVVEED